MSSTAADNDAEDVNDFLKRIQELGVRRDQEDEERNRKLEEEIMQGRKERQARRAERARSISPSKDSPANTPPSYKPSASELPGPFARSQLSPSRDPQSSNSFSTHDQLLDDAMERTTRERSPAKENTWPLTGHDRDRGEMKLGKPDASEMSPSSATPPARSPTLSWQQRPSSRASDRPRSRPLSMIATENAARSPRSTPEPSSAVDDNTLISRDQIAQSLGSKDPNWFRQTSDRGGSSAAYRKNQVEDSDVAGSLPISSRMQLPGMNRDPVKQNPNRSVNLNEIDRSSSPSRHSSSNGSVAATTLSSTTFVSSSIGSPIPLTSAQRLQPPGPAGSSKDENDATGSVRAPAMSPAQGRISPERLDRPPSPTKGMGGFVQSAMMKRSDSVSKRWSVQSSPGLSRGNSVASNRASNDQMIGMTQGASLTPAGGEFRPINLSRDSSPLPLSRPTSSHNNAATLQDNERPGTSGSMRSTMTMSNKTDVFVKPSLPTSRSQGLLVGNRDVESIDTTNETVLHVDTTPPASPSKTNDTRRWSPTKSSWLESALSKPDSPKPKPTPPPQQPSWMSELNKAKQRGAADSSVPAPSTHKHEVNIGGLMRSPPMGGTTKPLTMSGLPSGFSSGMAPRSHSPLQSSVNSKNLTPNITSSITKKAHMQDAQESSIADSNNAPSQAPEPSQGIEAFKNSLRSPAGGKIKPDTPPKKDLRANLKAHSTPPDNNSKDEPEFKNVFGQLRRTKTQNYVAPDELKDNILKGKAGLNTTGGPKKIERKDDFKEAILQKKEDFKKAQLEGTGVVRPVPGAKPKDLAMPEALARKATLGRNNNLAAMEPSSGKENNKASDETPTRQRVTRDLPKPNLTHEFSAPGRLQSNDSIEGKIVQKFNPDLAGILARGPPPESAIIPPFNGRPLQRSSDKAVGKDMELGPKLTHMTKSRARGPRRKAPSATTTNEVASEGPEKFDSRQPYSSASKKLDQRLGSSPIIGMKTSAVNVIAQDEPENAYPQQSSPRKLDIKRRSKFLEEVPNKNEKTPQQLDSPKPSSPTKKANAGEIASKKEESEQSPTILKESPTSKSKPLPLPKSPALAQTQSAPQKLSSQQEDPPRSSTKPKPSPLPKPSHAEFMIPPNKKPSQTKVTEDLENTSNMKDAATLFSRPSTTIQETQAKSPIKLPIRSGEENIKPASVRSPPAPSQQDQGPIGSKSGPTPAVLSKPSLPPPLNFNSKPGSSQAMRTPSTPQGMEISKELNSFFIPVEAAHDFSVDTAAVLSTRPDNASKVKSLRSQLFQLNNDGKKQAVPAHQDRILFESNMYICPHTFINKAGIKFTEVYFWIGDDVSESVSLEAALFAQREAKSAGGQLVKIKQGKETAEFLEALGGVIIVRRGLSSRYDSLAPHILCGRRHVGQIAFDEVDFSPASLCSGFPFLISTQSGKTYLWKGRGSGIDELSCARLIGMEFGATGEIEEVEDGKEPAAFLSLFGNDVQIIKSADHWRMKPNYAKYGSRLFCADSAPKSSVIEIFPFSQADLSPSKIYILDAFFEIYIIVGARSQSQYSAFCTALVFAQEYGILAAGMEDRPFVPISTVVLEGIPRDLKFVFRKWRDALAPTLLQPPRPGLGRGRSLRVVPLTAALDATRC